MPHNLLLSAFAHTASAWMPVPAAHRLALDISILSPLPPILIVAASVAELMILLLVIILMIRQRHHRRARRPRPPLPREALELYDLRTAGLTEEIRFCVELARTVGGPVLELGAGTGRITLEMARRGLLVTGLEASRRRLQWAKTRIERFSAKRRVEWVEGALTSFSLGGRTFKLILAPFNALEEVHDLNDLEGCLHSVAGHLEPDGIFVAIVQPPRWEACSGERRYVNTLYNPRTGEVVNSYQSLEVDPFWHQLSGTDTHEIWDQRGRRREVVAPFEASYLTCPQMALLLRAANMRLEAVYGSFAREPLTLKSRQMIFVASLLPQAIQRVPQQTPAFIGTGATRADSRADATVTSQPGTSSAVVPTSSSTSATAEALLPLPTTSGAPLGAPRGNGNPPADIQPEQLGEGSIDASGTAEVSLASGVQSHPDGLPGRSTNGSQRSSKPEQ
jgi:SAM-dependent methyltransferase